MYLQTAYEEAKRQIEKEDWEPKISGIEKIVAVTRKAPDVMKYILEILDMYLYSLKIKIYNIRFQILRNDIKTIVRLMLGELKNLRSQVCRSAALVNKYTYKYILYKY